MSTSTGTSARRRAAYAEVAAASQVDALLVSSAAAVRHATGLSMFTQRLIPDRPLVAWIGADAVVTVVACVLDQPQFEHERPDLRAVYYPEYGSDIWNTIASTRPAGARRVLVEDTLPAAGLAALSGTGAEVAISDRLLALPRSVKDDDEIAHLTRLSQAAEAALAEGAEATSSERTEREVADIIAAAFARHTGGAFDEVMGRCIAPINNRSMHHTPTDETIGRGPVRLGVLAWSDGYPLIVTRMVLVGAEATFERAYRDYVTVYERTLQDLRPGAQPASLYRACRDDLAALGYVLETMKIGHGTGLAFREPPILSRFEELALPAGCVLAFDYGLESQQGRVLHIEDRVLVTEHGPRRLSDGWKLDDLHGGWAGMT